MIEAISKVVAHRVVLGDRPVVVLSIGLDGLLPSVFTSAERDIVLALILGESPQDIAMSRGTSLNTVNNQIAAIFRKMVVNSRAELLSFIGRNCAQCGMVRDCPSCLASKPRG